MRKIDKVVLHGGTHIDNDEDVRSAHVGTLRGTRDATEPRFWGDHSSKSILDKLKAIQILNGCASQERVAGIKSGANYCCSYCFRSLLSQQ